MPLSQEQKLTLFRRMLDKITAEVRIAKAHSSAEDKARHGTLNALRESLERTNPTTQKSGKASQASQAMILDERFKRCIATVEQGIGACSNVASHFAWQYICATKQLDVTLVMVNNAVEGTDHENHMFVIIGPSFLGTVPLKEGECSRTIGGAIDLSSFLSIQPTECIIVDPFHNCCFPLTDTQAKNAFLATCRTTPSLFHLDFFRQRYDLLPRVEEIQEEILLLAHCAHEAECLRHLDMLMPFLLPGHGARWEKTTHQDKHAQFSYVLPTDSPQALKIIRDFLRSPDIYGDNKILKDTKSVLGSTQVTLLIDNPKALSLYGIIVEVRAQRDAFRALSAFVPSPPAAAPRP